MRFALLDDDGTVLRSVDIRPCKEVTTKRSNGYHITTCPTHGTMKYLESWSDFPKNPERAARKTLGCNWGART